MEMNINGVVYVPKVKTEQKFVLATEGEHPFEVGKAYFFRTVTFHLTGKVVAKHGKFLELSDAAWIADSGRFADAIASGKLNEVEPVGIAYLNTDTITDVFPWRHKLPTEQK